MNRRQTIVIIILLLVFLSISTFWVTLIADFHSAIIIDIGHIFVLSAFVVAYFRLGFLKYVTLVLAIVPYMAGINEAIVIINKAPIGSSYYALTQTAPVVLPLIIIGMTAFKLHNFERDYFVSNKSNEGK
jgi:hypothetical protein